MRVLVSWLGSKDLELMDKGQFGALASIALAPKQTFDQIVILANDWEAQWSQYEEFLKRELAKALRPFQNVAIRKASIKSPIDYPSITKTFKDLILTELSSANQQITINLTSGTPAMATVSVLVGKGLSHCEFVQSSVKQGVQYVDIPIDFKASYQSVTNQRLNAVTTSEPPIESAFEQMVTHSPAMKDCVRKAQKLATTELPALILGETGTGKERLATAIHADSLRGNQPMKTVNCGAIQENLIDSILFGHKKGAFTGADKDRKGLFEQASGGTVFLDEVGELSADAQVKLLRVLQQKEIVPVGSQTAIKVDIRVIAATHRDLVKMIDHGEFREDLYYRLAVGVVEIPALRERVEDLPELITALVSEINSVAGKHLDCDSKNISKEVIKFTSLQVWPGNIRELWNTLSRAILWSETDQLSLEDIKLAMHRRSVHEINEQPQLKLGKTVDLDQILDNISKNYISDALEITGGNKSKACNMLGIASHQTLQNRMNKLGIK